ncbi:MAG: hypothetical protein KC466_02310 [Myxococcales bacterium]|nr:hypothetical protein [Myxococcales bacterium]
MHRSRRGWGAVGVLALIPWMCFCFAVATAWAEPPETVESLRRELNDLRREGAERDKRMQRLEERLEELRSAPPSAPSAGARANSEDAASALDRALAELPEAAPTTTASRDVASTRVGGATLRLIDVSLAGVFYGGGSTAPNSNSVDFGFLNADGEPAAFSRDRGLLTLQSGGHDPKARGFTIAQAELSLGGAVDPYFTAESHTLFIVDPIEGETSVELEEAFLTTTFLPYGFALEVGQSFTEFGLLNPTHPHAWDWIDQPVILSRLFGGDGMRGAGFRLDWLTPLPWFSELSAGMQNASGETMTSFRANAAVYDEAAPGGRPFRDQSVRSLRDFVYQSRWVNGFDLTDDVTVKVGASGLWGPNATGPDGWTGVWGGDILALWRPASQHQGYPFVKFQGEVLGRRFHADGALSIQEGMDEEGNPVTDVNFLRNRDLVDWGLYAELLGGVFTRIGGVQAGLRYEYATGYGGRTDAVDGDAQDFEVLGSIARRDDPLRSDRQRLSPLLVWRPSEFARVRLQYNYDRAAWLPNGAAHSVWLGFDFLIGTHPAHRF